MCCGLDRARIGGRGGIRTHGALAGTPVFKTGALNHSATLPIFNLMGEGGADCKLRRRAWLPVGRRSRASTGKACRSPARIAQGRAALRFAGHFANAALTTRGLLRRSPHFRRVPDAVSLFPDAGVAASACAVVGCLG
jgi:hypothetical protein